MEVDAPASGVLRFVAASEGDVLPVGTCVGWIVADGEDFAPQAGAPSPSPRPSPDSPSKDGRSSERPTGRGGAAPPEGERPRATPAARRLARERGLRLESVRGSGPRGRVQQRDIEAPTPAAPGAAGVHRLWLSRGKGAPVVFLHGFGADLNGWRPVHRLLPETRPGLAIDLPGHGLSPLGEDASFQALVEAARVVLAEERVAAAHLVGHSLGGAVAASLAHKPGVNALSLMLIAPAGLGEDVNAAFFDGFLRADTEAALAPWLRMLATDPSALGSALARTTLRQRRERPLVSEQRRLAEMAFASGRQAIGVRDLLASPTRPTKIVIGLEDRITPPHHTEGLSGLIALHRFPHIGHMPHLEARREVARLIEELIGAAGS